MTTKIVHTRQESKKGSIEALNTHLDYLEYPTHTAAEREAIERKLIAEICPGSPARTVWCENPVTGEGVLRTIFPKINPEGAKKHGKP